MKQSVGVERPLREPTWYMTGWRAAEMVAPVQDQRLEREIIELPDGMVLPRRTLLAPETRRSGRAGGSRGLQWGVFTAR